MLFNGLRAISFRRNHKQSKADDIACIVAGFFGAWLLWHGILLVAGFQADRIGLQGPGIADFGAIV